MAEQRPTLVLFDGNAIVHRAYHALPPFTAPSGEPVGAVYGFATIVLGALELIRPDFGVVAWDKSGTTFRSALSADYKATRTETEADLKSQFPRVRELIMALGLGFIELEGYEADDVIATLARAHEATHRVVIVTGDMDALQLVSPEVSVYMMRRGITDLIDYTPDEVMTRYGIRPDQIVDYKALRGDSSDNIPGVPGIGEKTATALLEQYDNLEAIYEHLSEIPGAKRTRLEEGRESGFLSRELATMVTDLDIDVDLESSRVGVYDRERALELFRSFGFRSLHTKLPQVHGAAQKGPTTQASRGIESILVDDEEKLAGLLAEIESSEVVAFDTETTGLDPLEAELVGISLSTQAGRGYYVPVAHSEGKQLSRERVLEVFKSILASDKLKVAHNLKFDLAVCETFGWELTPPYFDTMLAAYLLSAGTRAESLAALAFQEFGEEMQPISELIGTGRSSRSFAEVPISEALPYAAHDAEVALRLYEVLRPRLEAESLTRVLEEIELPLVPILSAMERRGIRIDPDYLDRLGEKMQGQITRLEKQICEAAGCEFNIGSPAQLSEILYEKLGLSTAGVKRGKTGYSTAASELDKLRGQHPIIELISEYRELTKLKNTYIDALPRLVSERDGRVHTDYGQAIAATGRLSSTNPNLQNIPIRTEQGRAVRRAFIAEPGHRLLSVDYSQIELRIVAHLASDTALIDAFRRGADIHTETAAKVAGVPPEQVSREMRYAAKAVNFGIMYGLSAHGLASSTAMSREEATDFIERYFELYPGIKAFMDETKALAHSQGYVETLLGRRRYLPEIASSNFAIRAGAERIAINMPVQGTAADIMKLAMIRLAPLLPPEAPMLLQVHDELVFEVPEQRVDEIAALVRREMAAAYELTVPLEVEAKAGENWDEMTELT